MDKINITEIDKETKDFIDQQERDFKFDERRDFIKWASPDERIQK